MACEDQLEDLPRMLREMSTQETARNEVAGLLHQVATAIERTSELLRARMRVPALFVSSPGMLYWGGKLQQFVYMLTEVVASAAVISTYARPVCALERRVCALPHSRRMQTWQEFHACCSL